MSRTLSKSIPYGIGVDKAYLTNDGSFIIYKVARGIWAVNAWDNEARCSQGSPFLFRKSLKSAFDAVRDI